MINDALWIKAGEVLDDVRSAAWMGQELHPELDGHRRHQMADICERDNIERVWRVLGSAVADIRLELSRMLAPEHHTAHTNDLRRPDGWSFHFLFPLPSPTASYLREKIHEYLVASVMADRTAVIIPEDADIWRERSEEARSGIRGIAATTLAPNVRARRPIWPM
ncbi:MAG: hypothetical protein K2H22_02940 [Muribaculaceae bacterium]|nr:hypothetical protein [Muribaculaceae bacterium]